MADASSWLNSAIAAVPGLPARRVIWLFGEENWQRRIELLDRLDLRIEVSVLAGLVGVLEVDEEEVVVLVLPDISFELLGDGGGALDLDHADELSQALVHGVNRQSCWFQLVALLEGGDVRLMGDATHEKSVRGFLVLQEWKCGLVEVGNQLGDLLLSGILRINW